MEEFDEEQSEEREDLKRQKVAQIQLSGLMAVVLDTIGECGNEEVGVSVYNSEINIVKGGRRRRSPLRAFLCEADTLLEDYASFGLEFGSGDDGFSLGFAIPPDASVEDVTDFRILAQKFGDDGFRTKREMLALACSLRTRNFICPPNDEIRAWLRKNKGTSAGDCPYLCGFLRDKLFSDRFFPSIELREGVFQLGDETFSGNARLRIVKLPATIREIGSSCFADCKELSKINIPPLVTKIRPQTFLYCRSLFRIDLGENVRSIGGGAFAYCEGLYKISLPKSLRRIGPDAFRDCLRLQVVLYGGSEEDWNKIEIGEGNEFLKTAQIRFVG